MTDQIEHIPPRRGFPPILCRYCAEEIEAVAPMHTIIGTAYLWRHVNTEQPTCRVTYTAEPYDTFAADRQLAEGKRLAEEAEVQAALETLDAAGITTGEQYEQALRAVSTDA